MPRRPARKVITIEVETSKTNKDLKALVKDQLSGFDGLRVVQAEVDAIRSSD